MGVGGVWPVAARAASTLSDKPRWEKDIEPLVETAAWNPGTTVAPIPERHANLHGIFGYADRRLIQDIAFRYRAASKRNIGVNWPKSMEQAREALKKLNVSVEMLEFRIVASRIRPPSRRRMNRRYKSADYRIWRVAATTGKSGRGREKRWKVLRCLGGLGAGGRLVRALS